MFFMGFLSIYRCFSPKKMGSPRWHRLLPWGPPPDLPRPWERGTVEVSARVENGGFKPSIAEVGSSELFGGKWWKMMENDGKWWKMMENDGKWWKMMENDEKLWKMMKNDEKWWKMMEDEEKHSWNQQPDKDSNRISTGCFGLLR